MSVMIWDINMSERAGLCYRQLTALGNEGRGRKERRLFDDDDDDEVDERQ